MYRLTHSSLDDEVEVSDHHSLDAAIEAAVTWFQEGYDNPVFGGRPEYLPDDIARLRADLAAGREFYCNNFFERVTVAPVIAKADS